MFVKDYVFCDASRSCSMGGGEGLIIRPKEHTAPDMGILQRIYLFGCGA
jgi:hypothetical protein